MTLWASRAGQQITITATYGPVISKFTEDAQHVAHFWGELGKLIEAAEAERHQAAESLA